MLPPLFGFAGTNSIFCFHRLWLLDHVVVAIDFAGGEGGGDGQHRRVAKRWRRLSTARNGYAPPDAEEGRPPCLHIFFLLRFVDVGRERRWEHAHLTALRGPIQWLARDRPKFWAGPPAPSIGLNFDQLSQHNLHSACDLFSDPPTQMQLSQRDYSALVMEAAERLGMPNPPWRRRWPCSSECSATRPSSPMSWR